MERSFSIEPNDAGGWRLRLLEDSTEVGGGAFPNDEYSDALEMGQDWVGLQPVGATESRGFFPEAGGPE